MTTATSPGPATDSAAAAAANGASQHATEIRQLLEFCDWRGTAPRVDGQQGVLRGVKILGVRSQNGRVYLPEALGRAIGLYEGAKVNVNHPKGHPRAPRDYQERIGSIRNVVLRDGEGLFGDFHYNPRHALSEQLAWDAANAPENVGFSHNVEARLARRDDQWVVEAITRVTSVDLVADPATTGGLFEAAGSANGPTLCADDRTGASAPQRPQPRPEPQRRESIEPGALTCASLRQLRPDLVDALLLEQSDQRQRLQEEVDRLRDETQRLRRQSGELEATAALARRRQLAESLLAEFQLPGLESDDPAARAILSAPFVESLLSAADERQMRRLVEERAGLIAGVRQGLIHGGAWPVRPVSRAPRRSADDASTLDTKAFVRAIRG